MTQANTQDTDGASLTDVAAIFGPAAVSFTAMVSTTAPVSLLSGALLAGGMAGYLAKTMMPLASPRKKIAAYFLAFAVGTTGTSAYIMSQEGGSRLMPEVSKILNIPITPRHKVLDTRINVR